MTCNVVQNWRDTGPYDPSWLNVASLIHFDGVQGNTVFTDAVKGNILTLGGGVTTDQVNPLISPSSGVFPGSGSDQRFLIKLPQDDLGSNDFTLEVYFSMDVVQDVVFFDARPNSVNGNYLCLTYNTGKFGLFQNNAYAIQVAQALTANTRYHLALSRKGGSTYLFLNGKLVFTRSFAGTYLVPAISLGENGFNYSLGHFQGKMSEFRYTKGLARYDAEFTPDYTRFPDH